MKIEGWTRTFAILIVAVFAISLIINSTNSTNDSTSTTANVVKELTADPKCGVEGGQGTIVVEAEQVTFSSPYKTKSQGESVDWLNENARGCNRAEDSFDSFCGTMFGNCRTQEKSCEQVDNRVDFDCDTDLPQRCESGEVELDGKIYYRYECSIDSYTIELGTCTCEYD